MSIEHVHVALGEAVRPTAARHMVMWHLESCWAVQSLSWQCKSPDAASARMSRCRFGALMNAQVHLCMHAC
jgi:hypothetical protein